MKKDDFSLDENWVHVGCDDHRLACFLQTELDLSFRESVGELVGLLHFIHDEKETCFWGKLQTFQGTPQFGC